MAQQKETSLADVMQQMLAMQVASVMRTREREDQREQDRIDREEQAKQGRLEREKAQRDRRAWEENMRTERDRREERLLIALREAQPTVPQTVHINSNQVT